MNHINVAIINHSKTYIDPLVTLLCTDPDFRISGTANNQYDAYHLICCKQPDVVLLDLSIENDNSFQFIEKVKNTSSLSKTPQFIIITSAGNESTVSQAFQHDISYFILTPFEPKYTLNRIKQIVKSNLDIQEMEEKISEAKATTTIDYSISTLLYKLGIPSNVKGYKYIKCALKKCTQDSSLLEGVTKLLYPEIAKEYKTTSTSVEHAIRNLIKNSCENEHTKQFDLLFGNNLQKTLTNSEFISIVSNSLRVNTIS